MPKGKDHGEKLKNIEKKLINEAKKELRDVKFKVVDVQSQNDLKKKEKRQKEEKIELLKSKLRKRALDAQKVVNRAIDVGEADKV